MICILALKGFLPLQDDSKYKELVPYYIAEIYVQLKNYDKAQIVAQNYLSAYPNNEYAAEITAAIPITAIAIHRSLLLVFFRLFLLFPFFILTSIHFALLIWSYSIFNVRYIFKILHS